MKKKNILYICILLLMPMLYTSLGSNSSGVTGKSTSGCTPCHGGSNTSTNVVVTGIPAGGYMAGQTYTCTLAVANTSYANAPNRAGFNLTVDNGTLTAGAGMNLSGTQELAHSTPVTMSNLGAASWTFDWTAPTGSTATSVTFSAAANATDGDFGTGGDAHNTTTATYNLGTSSSMAPTVANVTATSITDVAATISALVTANGATTGATVEYGLTTSYGSNSVMTPMTITGTTPTSMTTNLTGLTPNTTYHYRVAAANTTGTTNSPDATFTTDFPNSVREVKVLKCETYPNPSKKFLKVKMEEEIIKAEFSLVTMGGKLVKTSFEKIDAYTIQIDVADLAKGNYILSMEVNGHAVKQLVSVE